MSKRDDSFLKALNLAAFDMADEAEEKIANIPDYVFSPKFERKIKKLNSHIRKDKYRKLSTLTRNILIAAVMAIILSVGVLASTSNLYKEEFEDFLLKEYHGITTLIFEKHGDEKNPSLIHSYDYMTDGFTQVIDEDGNKLGCIIYRNSSGKEISSIAVSSGQKIYINTVDTITNEIVLANGETAICFEREDYTELMWAVDDVTYMLQGPVSSEELVRISQSLKKEKR